MDWKDISISTFENIVEITKNTEYTDVEKTARLISLIYNIGIEEVFNWKIENIISYKKEFDFINHFDIDYDIDYDNVKKEDVNIKYLEYGGKKYDINLDLDLIHFNVSQYIDFMSYYNSEDDERNIGQMLSTIILPRGAKYNDLSYNLYEWIEIIKNSIDIVTANKILFFFIKNSTTYRPSTFQQVMMRLMAKRLTKSLLKS